MVSFDLRARADRPETPGFLGKVPRAGTLALKNKFNRRRGGVRWTVK